MRLTQYTDFSLRVLIYLALRPERRCTIREISEAYAISHNHLMKVVQKLANEGFVHSTRGVGGGLNLARKPADIVIGDVVRCMEPDLGLVECMRPENQCVITSVCALAGMLVDSRKAFLAVLDDHTLDQIVSPQRASALANRLNIRIAS